MRLWKTISRKTILNKGRFLVVENHTIELPDGRIITDWPWLITPEYVNVVVVTNENEFLCFRQTKYAVGGATLAVVGGYLEPGEDPLAGAQRELLEETGYTASAWVSLGQYAVDGNRGAGTAHLFLARQSQRVADVNTDDLEEQQLLRLSRAEVELALLAGDFKVLPNAAAIALALQRMHEA